MEKVKRRRLGMDVWRALVAKHVDSGQTIHAFCAHEGISPSTFLRWRSLLNGDGAPASEQRNAVGPAGAFVDLGALNGAAPERFELRLDLGGGLTLQLVRG